MSRSNYLVRGTIISREWLRFSSHVFHYLNVKLMLPELVCHGSKTDLSVELTPSSWFSWSTYWDDKLELSQFASSNSRSLTHEFSRGPRALTQEKQLSIISKIKNAVVSFFRYIEQLHKWIKKNYFFFIFLFLWVLNYITTKYISLKLNYKANEKIQLLYWPMRFCTSFHILASLVSIWQNCIKWFLSKIPVQSKWGLQTLKYEINKVDDIISISPYFMCIISHIVWGIN